MTSNKEVIDHISLEFKYGSPKKTETLIIVKVKDLETNKIETFYGTTDSFKGREDQIIRHIITYGKEIPKEQIEFLKNFFDNNL